MTDQALPFIQYEAGKSHREWGLCHGESFREGIKELSSIRRDLMLKKNPSLLYSLDKLAHDQFEISKSFAPHLAQELEGIANGANISLTDIVILNNYTDFRDIEMPDEGCSTVHIQSNDQVVSGQTWDMHSSAKDYISVIEVPENQHGPKCYLFSLVGCLGMMGINESGLFIGVNNINTKNAKAGLIWPLLVRHTLEQKSFEQMKNKLTGAPVTSGHNYLISDSKQSEHWEISPSAKELLFHTDEHNLGQTFHTNHCLGKFVKEFEQETAKSSTTYDRYDLLSKKINQTKNFNDLIELFRDHEGYPKAICSHFESGAQDPSMTCGGAAYDHHSKSAFFWRGCKEFDSNYKDLMLQF